MKGNYKRPRTDDEYQEGQEDQNKLEEYQGDNLFYPHVNAPGASEKTTGGILSINVGGKVFQTLKSTFNTPHSGEYFRNLLFSDRFPQLRDAHGNVFIDRDPELFRYILEYLRTDQIQLSEDHDNIRFLQKLFTEADYYQLSDMQKEISEMILPKVRFSIKPWAVFIEGYTFTSGKRNSVVIPFVYTYGAAYEGREYRENEMHTNIRIKLQPPSDFINRFGRIVEFTSLGVIHRLEGKLSGEVLSKQPFFEELKSYVLEQLIPTLYQINLFPQYDTIQVGQGSILKRFGPFTQTSRRQRF